MRKIVVGVTGASGSAYALAALRALREHADIETHLVMSEQARKTAEIETDHPAEAFEALASVVHRDDNLAASISSGSFITDGMLVIPCSMKSASAIAYSFNANLLVRAADVCLKERRKLAEIGAIVLPPIPAMYAKPKSIDDIIGHTVGKALDQFGIRNDLFNRWK